MTRGSSQRRPAARRSSQRIAFLDFEASGLGAASWPIEVGWIVASTADREVRILERGGALIAPHDDWPRAAWDPAAERVHGLSFDYVCARGLALHDVARRLNAALAHTPVYSDAVEWDAFWLARLMAASDAAPAFRLSCFHHLIRARVAGDRRRAAAAHVAAQQPRPHRALADAAALYAIFAAACGPLTE